MAKLLKESRLHGSGGGALQGNSLEQCRKDLHTRGAQVTDLQALPWHVNCSCTGSLSPYGGLPTGYSSDLNLKGGFDP
jgi:hypothetical protein